MLTADEETVLAKGLNYNTGHKCKDILGFAATVDNEIQDNTAIPRE